MSKLVEKHLTPDEYEAMLTKMESTQNLELVTSDTLLQEYRDYNFEILKTVKGLDKMRVFVRGSVTRIGAYSNMGKSKFAYWVVKNMLENGYKGILFSTEVDRAMALANIISVAEKANFYDVIKKKHKISEKTKLMLNGLQVYDSRSGALYLKHIRDYVCCNKGNVDFIVTDFCQSIKDYQENKEEYTRLSAYALETQQLAQAFNICVIDLSQVANSGLRDDLAHTGFIAFKGSGGLYASADIGIYLTRDKIKTPNKMEVQVRKHKYYKTGKALFGADWTTGQFDYLTEEEIAILYPETEDDTDLYNLDLN